MTDEDPTAGREWMRAVVPGEPGWAAPLRVIGGVGGILRARAGTGPIDPRTAVRLADMIRLAVEELYAAVKGTD